MSQDNISYTNKSLFNSFQTLAARRFAQFGDQGIVKTDGSIDMFQFAAFLGEVAPEFFVGFELGRIVERVHNDSKS